MESGLGDAIARASRSTMMPTCRANPGHSKAPSCKHFAGIAPNDQVPRLRSLRETITAPTQHGPAALDRHWTDGHARRGRP